MMNSRVCLAVSLFLLLGSEAVVARGNTYRTDLFPTPEVLKPNVQFWINIYAKYSERQVVVHDSEDLGIVYEVINLDDLFQGLHIGSRLKWKKIENIRKQYRTILLRLSQRKDLKLENLRGKERQVAALFGDKLSRKRLRRAANRIRTQTGLKERFRQGLQRSGRYLNKMREIFEREGLPLELLVLPHVESSFNYRAYSKFGAAGIWQFTRSTGRYYMKINYEIDERRDPLLATEAAARHLKRNYQRLGSWPLAITAYNHGLNGMLRARRRYGRDLGIIVKYYKSRSFGFASRNFYAEFLAALHVTRNYKRYFGEVQFDRPLEFHTFKTPHYINIKALTDALGVTVEEFAELNPALRSPVLQGKRRIPKGVTLRIPKRPGLDVATLYASIPATEKHSRQVRQKWHRVRPGEYLSTIARRYGVRLSELMAINNIRNPHRIYVGQNLQIPAERPTRVARARKKRVTETAPQLAEATDLKPNNDRTVLDVPKPVRTVETDRPQTPPEERTPEVVALDVLPARPHATPGSVRPPSRKLAPRNQRSFESKRGSVEDEMTLALPDYYVELTRDMDVRIVKVPYAEFASEPMRELAFPQNGQVVVEPDETIGHFADWLDVPARRVRAINGLKYGQPIRVGQPLWLTFERVTPEEFHRRRVEYHQGIEEDFYRNFSVEGERTYKIQRGDNIWVICKRKFELPYWLVQKHNPGKDLLQLVAGDEIILPIVEARFPEASLEDD